MRKLVRPSCPNIKALSDHKNHKHPENKKVLMNASFEKCMYCESIFTHISYGDVEHIKPKKKFPHLEFVWDNLGISCSLCNGSKADQYYDDLPYINPYEEDPEEYLVFFGAVAYPKQGSERGEITIRDIKLNRIDLLEKRLNRLVFVEKAIMSCFRTKNESLKADALNELVKEAEIDKEYSCCIKSFLQAHSVTKKTQ